MRNRPFEDNLPKLPLYSNIIPEMLRDKGALGISTNGSDTAQHPYHISVHHTGCLAQRSSGLSLGWEVAYTRCGWAMVSPDQRQWKQWLQLCTAPHQAGTAAGSLLYGACGPLAPLPPDWGEVQGYETPEAPGFYILPLPTPYLPSSLLQSAASRIVAQASPKLVHLL